MPAALPPAPHAGRLPLRAHCDPQQYSRRQVGLGVQRPSDWQALAGSPSSRNPGRQLYRTTEPTHQSLPYTTELKSTSGRPQFTGDREVPVGSMELALHAACSAEPKETHPDKVAGPGQGPWCWAGCVGAPGCVPSTWLLEKPHRRVRGTKPALPRLAVPSPAAIPRASPGLPALAVPLQKDL